MRIIGRDEEQESLDRYLRADEPDFLVVYGRRRVGKTYLIREFFDDRFCFFFTGLANSSMEQQLRAFNKALREYGADEYPMVNDWLDAFAQLQHLVENSGISGKKVIFLDEMPWMDTPRSQFLTGLEWFWNGWASGRADILLIVCGSATSWITNKLFRNTGGLYNRVTARMHLQPFTLRECEEFFQARGVSMNRQEVVESYMIFGGIPFYLKLMDKKLSLSQNVDRLCFKRGGQLHDEYHALLHTLFKGASRHSEILEALSKKGKGLTRMEIIRATGLSNGGGLTTLLDELEQSGFMRKYHGFEKKSKDALYQLCDPFSLFWHRFLKGENNDEQFWTNNLQSGQRNAWSGYAFEQVCLSHIKQIKVKLGINGILTKVSAWQGSDPGKGAQIDMVIDRKDGVINLCEIKYSSRPYEITRKYDDELRIRRALFAQQTKTKKSLHITFISTYGITDNSYRGNIQSHVTMDDLFGG